jgi:hypothetical protein
MISSDEDKGCLLAPARFVCCLMKRENVLLCMKTRLGKSRQKGRAVRPRGRTGSTVCWQLKPRRCCRVLTSAARINRGEARRSWNSTTCMAFA